MHNVIKLIKASQKSQFEATQDLKLNTKFIVKKSADPFAIALRSFRKKNVREAQPAKSNCNTD